MDELNENGAAQLVESTAATAQDDAGNAAGGASGEQQPAVTSAQDASGSGVAGEQGNGAASPAVVQSASDTSLSASTASQEGGTAADNTSGAPAENQADHKSILEKLFEDLEGIVHMGKSEIIAVIDRAKSLL